MSPTLKSILFGGKGTGSVWGDLGLMILRVGTGVYMSMAHGMGKLFQDKHVGPPQKFIDATAKLGFPAPTFFAWCSALTECIVALMFALGLFTRPSAAILVFNMCIAAFVALLHAPWVADPGSASKEMAMLYLIPFVTILLTGPGHFSADAMIRTAGNE